MRLKIAFESFSALYSRWPPPVGQSWDLGGSPLAHPGLDQGGGTEMTEKDQREHERRKEECTVQGVLMDKRRKKREMPGVTYRFRGAAGKMCLVLFTAEEGVVGVGSAVFWVKAWWPGDVLSGRQARAGHPRGSIQSPLGDTGPELRWRLELGTRIWKPATWR